MSPESSARVFFLPGRRPIGGGGGGMGMDPPTPPAPTSLLGASGMADTSTGSHFFSLPPDFAPGKESVRFVRKVFFLCEVVG